MSDFEQILKLVRGIPIVDTLGIRLIEFGEGFCKATVPHDPRFDGIFRSYHGGLLTTVADCAACFAIMTITGAKESLTTTDMNIRFLAACLTDVTAEARVLKVGKTLCPVHVDLFDGNRQKVAVAQVCYMRLPRPPRHFTGGNGS